MQTCGQCGLAVPDSLHACGACGAVLKPSAETGRSSKSASDHITEKLGLERIEGFSLTHFFSEVFSRHTSDEIERLLSVGTPDTTPALHPAMKVMPNPWIFSRALIAVLTAYLVFLLGWRLFGNLNLVPGLIILGSFAMPLATLILFFELNTPRNISIVRLFEMVIVGGSISLLLSLVIFGMVPFLGALGASAAALVEECGKLAALLFAVRHLRSKYVYRLNGLLLGAAVGTGFAAFESAGYALRLGLHSAPAMLDLIQMRGLLSPFAHIAWTAIAASAFWMARPHCSSTTATLQSPRFLKLFAVPMALHFIWNLGFDLPFMGKYLILGFVAWVVIISLVQSGLKEMGQVVEALQPDPMPKPL